MFHISIWVLGALFGWANPTKTPRGDGTATCSTGVVFIGLSVAVKVEVFDS